LLDVALEGDGAVVGAHAGVEFLLLPQRQLQRAVVEFVDVAAEVIPAPRRRSEEARLLVQAAMVVVVVDNIKVAGVQQPHRVGEDSRHSAPQQRLPLLVDEDTDLALLLLVVSIPSLVVAVQQWLKSPLQRAVPGAAVVAAATNLAAVAAGGKELFDVAKLENTEAVLTAAVAE